jgi:hypothetical protein
MRERERVNGLVADVCMYTSRPAGYKLRGIDTKGENTSMLLRSKKKGKRGNESERKRGMRGQVSIKPK